jgi:hypothetical protein
VESIYTSNFVLKLGVEMAIIPKLPQTVGIELQTIRITETGYGMDAALIQDKFLVVCGNDVANDNVDPFLSAILYYLEQTREVAPTLPTSILPALILICHGAPLNLNHDI